MPNQTMISVKMDKSLKAAAQKTAAEFGLPLGTMINAMLREVVKSRQLTLTTSEVPSVYLKKVLREAKKEIPKLAKKKGYTLDEMFAKLSV